jgi:hypothetical protein
VRGHQRLSPADLWRALELEIEGAQGEIVGADRAEHKRKRVAEALLVILNVPLLALPHSLVMGLIVDIATHAIKNIIQPMQRERRKVQAELFRLTEENDVLRVQLADERSALAMTRVVLERLESERPSAPPAAMPDSTGPSGVGSDDAGP